MISVSSLTRIYKLGRVEVRASMDVSLSLEAGDITCVMGKSGSGKSTLLRQLGLIDRPTSGQIVFDGKDVTRLSDGARARMRLTYLGYIFQEFALLGELTAHENVYLPGMMLGSGTHDHRKRAAELLEMVGLGGANTAQAEGTVRRRATAGSHCQGIDQQSACSVCR